MHAEDYTPRELNGPLSDYYGAMAPAQRARAIDGLRGDYEQGEDREASEFFETLVQECEKVRAQCVRVRDAMGFTPAFFDRNERRSVNKLKVRFDELGDVDDTYEDGRWATCGLSAGLAAQAIRTMTDYSSQAYIERTKRFYQARGNGAREENKSLCNSMDATAGALFKAGQFERLVPQRFHGQGTHGFQAMRYEMTAKKRVSFNPQTGVTETRDEIAPAFTLWPIRDVLISHPERPSAAEQEVVIWIQRGITIGELEANEATYELDFDPDTGGPVGFRRVAGEFINLARLRRSALDFNGTSGGERTATDSSGQETIHGAGASTAPKFDFARYEGPMPPAAINKLTWRIMALLGLESGVERPAEDLDAGMEGNEGAYGSTSSDGKPGGDDDALEEARLRISQLPMLKISYRLPGSMEGGGGGDRTDDCLVHQCEPSATGRNSLYIYGYKERGRGGAFKIGIPELIDPLEMAHGMHLNDAARLANHAANPSAVVDKTGLKVRTDAEIGRMFRPKERISKAPGRSLKEFLELVRLESPPEMLAIMNTLREMAFDLSGVLPAIAGGASANTYGQDLMNKTSAQNAMDAVVIGTAKEDYRLIEDMLEDLWMYLGPQGFKDYVLKAGGYHAASIEDDLDDMDKVWEEISFDHPSAFGRDLTVMSAQFDEKMANPFYAQMVDPAKALITSLTMAGFPSGEDILADGWEILDPETEQRMMLVGNRVTPNPKMDPMEFSRHISAHLAELQAIEQGVSRYNPKRLPALRDGLTRWLRTAVNQLELQGAITGAMGMGMDPAMAGAGMSAGMVGMGGAPAGLPAPEGIVAGRQAAGARGGVPSGAGAKLNGGLPPGRG